MTNKICGKVNATTVKADDHYLQFVPVKMKDGVADAKVKPFFTDCIQEKSEGELSTVLRGRPLDGKVIALDNFKAAIVKVPNSASGAFKHGDSSEEGDIECHTISSCNKITVWNYDMPHAKGQDPLSRGLAYAELARIAHDESD